VPVDLSFLLPLLATTFGIFLILAISFNLEYGYAGQPNLGKVFFYSIGAYVAGALTTHALWALAGSPANIPFLEDAGGVVRFEVARANPAAILGLFVASLVVGGLAGAAFGWLASYPALRLRGDFLAIVLIAVGEVSRVFVFNYEPIAGGVFGLSGVPNPFSWLPPRVSDAVYAVVVLVIAFGVYVYAVRLTKSPYGRLLKSVRDDELASNVYGKATPKVKGHVLMLAGGLAAVAGVLYVFYVQTVYAGDFIPLVSFVVITMVIVGGVANHKGVLLGAAFITLIDLVTRPVFPTLFDIYWRPPFDMNYVRYLTVGLIIIVVLMFRPKGLIPERPVETAALRVARRWGKTAAANAADRATSEMRLK